MDSGNWEARWYHGGIPQGDHSRELAFLRQEIQKPIRRVRAVLGNEEPDLDEIALGQVGSQHSQKTALNLSAFEP